MEWRILGPPGSRGHPEDWLAVNIQQLSLGSEEGRSSSLSTCPGTNRPLPLPCHFPLQCRLETWSALLMWKFLLCKTVLLGGSKKGALSFLWYYDINANTGATLLVPELRAGLRAQLAAFQYLPLGLASTRAHTQPRNEPPNWDRRNPSPVRADDLAQTQADQGALGVSPRNLFIWDLGLFLSYCYLDKTLEGTLLTPYLI